LQIPPAFSIVITAPATSVRLGSPIPLKLFLTDLSQKSLGVQVRAVGPEYKGEKFRDMDIRVLDSSGKPVEETDLGRTVHGRNPKISWGVQGTKHGGIAIGTGQTLTEQADLSKEFDLSKPGTYTAQAERWDGEHGQMIRSNTITITITE